MNKTRIATITCCIIAAVSLCGLAVWFAVGLVSGNMHLGMFGWGIIDNGGPFYKVGSYSIPADDLDTIKLDWVGGEINVSAYQGDEVIITEYAQTDLEEDEILYYTNKGGGLFVTYCEKNQYRRIPMKNIDVQIPQSVMENLDVMDIDTTSGMVYLKDINTQSLEINTVSGEASVSNVTTKEFVFDSTSGALDLAGMKTDSLKIGTVSGEANVSDVITNTFDFSSTSGDLYTDNLETDTASLNSVSGTLTFFGTGNRFNGDSTSGDIIVSSSQIPQSIDISTISAEVEIIVPEDENIIVDYSTVSGDFRSAFPVKTSQSGSMFRIDTTSGDLEITAFAK